MHVLTAHSGSDQNMNKSCCSMAGHGVPAPSCTCVFPCGGCSPASINTITNISIMGKSSRTYFMQCAVTQAECDSTCKCDTVQLAACKRIQAIACTACLCECASVIRFSLPVHVSCPWKLMRSLLCAVSESELDSSSFGLLAFTAVKSKQINVKGQGTTQAEISGCQG